MWGRFLELWTMKDYEALLICSSNIRIKKINANTILINVKSSSAHVFFSWRIRDEKADDIKKWTLGKVQDSRMNLISPEAIISKWQAQ